MALGAILGRFGAQVGGQVGAKLGRKSEKWMLQDDVKKSVVKNLCECTPMYAGRDGGVPYNQSIKHSQDTTTAATTTTRTSTTTAPSITSSKNSTTTRTSIYDYYTSSPIVSPLT